MDEAWQAMDDWCVKQRERLGAQAVTMLNRKRFDTSDPTYRVVLGQQQAFNRMRSFIHWARQQ